MNFDDLNFYEGTTYDLEVTTQSNFVDYDNDFWVYLIMLKDFFMFFLNYISLIKGFNFGMIIYYVFAIILFVVVVIFYYCK